MMPWPRLASIVEDAGRAAFVTLREVRGSTPREAGASLILRPDGGFHGTIGGGALEWRALDLARCALEGAPGARLEAMALGPDCGQCCGGRVTLLVESFDRADLPELHRLARWQEEAPDGLDLVAAFGPDGRVRRERPGPGGVPQGGWHETYGIWRLPLALFGAGHVGRALVLALAPLPVAIRWIDPRPDAFPSVIAGDVATQVQPDPAACLGDLDPGSAVLVMTHDHGLDLAIVAGALRRPDLPFVGLIGSLTKRARFLRRLAEAGSADADSRLVCPVGVPDLRDKHPAIIAAGIAVELLRLRQQLMTSRMPATTRRRA
jgi:xanthine dehydrogenase accessory factor